MQTLDDEIERLITAGIISPEDGLAHAQNKDKISGLLKENPR